MFLSSSEISSRLVSDLRLGLPIILYDAKTYFLTAAIETLYSEKLDKIMEIAKNQNFEIILFFEGCDDSRMLKMHSGEV